MDTRLRATVTTPGWCRTITHVLGLGVPFEKLEVAEVGCGSGTYSLAWALLGARTTLIDADEEALVIARNAFNLYEVEAEFVKADVLNIPPKELVGRFHLVASGGLAEHFVGENRTHCFAFHRALLTKTGIARLAVPNRLSPFYRFVRGFRMLTGTWDLDIEIAYDPDELSRLAEASGFRRWEVFGNNFLRKGNYSGSPTIEPQLTGE